MPLEVSLRQTAYKSKTLSRTLPSPEDASCQPRKVFLKNEDTS